MQKNNFFKIDPVNPDIKIIKKAASIIENGGIAIVPAKFFYGLSADVFNANAVNKIFKIKKRAFNKPLLILIENKSLVSKFAKNINKTAKKLMANFWPGNITLVFDAKKNIPKNITGGSHKIGIRVPKHIVCNLLLKHFKGKAITSTSVNLSGFEPASSIEKIDKKILDSVDIILDVGKLPKGKLSTVVDVTKNIVLREGIIKKEEIKNLKHN